MMDKSVQLSLQRYTTPGQICSPRPLAFSVLPKSIIGGSPTVTFDIHPTKFELNVPLVSTRASPGNPPVRKENHLSRKSEFLNYSVRNNATFFRIVQQIAFGIAGVEIENYTQCYYIVLTLCKFL